MCVAQSLVMYSRYVLHFLSTEQKHVMLVDSLVLPFPLNEDFLCKSFVSMFKT